MFIIVISRLIPSLQIPALTFGIPLSITNVYFAITFAKDKGFLYITPARLEAIIIADKQSGIPLFSKNFHEETPAEDLLSSLFNALNYSLQETIHSTTDIEHIGFGDKSVLIASGNRVSSLMIVSEINLVTQSISKYLTKTFEQNYKDLIQMEKEMPVHQSDLFKEFSVVVDRIRQYIPL